jgi:hypothetical protein
MLIAGWLFKSHSLRRKTMQRSPDDKKEEETKLLDKPNEEITALEKRPKKFHNGWGTQLENLAAEWADKAACYQWMHEKTEGRFVIYNMYLTIPVIILSTLTGTANFGVQSLLPDPSYGKYASAIIGGVSLISGMISTLANFLRYAQASESHRVAAISWGKFQRFVSTELALHPNERMDAMSFLKMARIELDRLIEQAPIIPPNIIRLFKKEFNKKADLVVPEIAGGLGHTKVYVDTDSRFARVAADATFILQQKKGLLRQLVVEDFDKHIVKRTKEERARIEDELREEMIKAARDAALRVVQEKVPKLISGPYLTNNVSNTATTEVHTIGRSPPKIPLNKVSTMRSNFEKGDAPKPIASVADQVAAVAAQRNANLISLVIDDVTASVPQPVAAEPPAVPVVPEVTPVVPEVVPVVPVAAPVVAEAAPVVTETAPPSEETKANE